MIYTLHYFFTLGRIQLNYFNATSNEVNGDAEKHPDAGERQHPDHGYQQYRLNCCTIVIPSSRHRARSFYVYWSKHIRNKQ